MTGLRELRRRAEELSGYPYSAVEAARGANLYERVGAERLELMSHRFYDRVYDDEQWFRRLFANTTREAAIQNQVEFLGQEFGGPRLYEQRKGCTMILGRHGAYGVDGRAAKRWLEHMRAAMGDVGVEGEESELMKGYFGHMAWYIVFGVELVNGGRTVGYYGKHKEGDV